MTKYSHDTWVTLTLTMAQIIDLRCAVSDAVMYAQGHNSPTVLADNRRVRDAFLAMTNGHVEAWLRQLDDEYHASQLPTLDDIEAMDVRY